ncbi:hypothetical protein SALBM135S_07551 [Streptomyces alboniger]
MVKSLPNGRPHNTSGNERRQTASHFCAPSPCPVEPVKGALSVPLDPAQPIKRHGSNASGPASTFGNRA